MGGYRCFFRETVPFDLHEQNCALTWWDGPHGGLCMLFLLHSSTPFYVESSFLMIDFLLLDILVPDVMLFPQAGPVYTGYC